MTIGISTLAFNKQGRDEIVGLAEENNWLIEFSSSFPYQEDMVDFFLKTKVKRLAHNYFPAPKVPFVINLASTDEKIRETSIEHCLLGLRLSKECGAPFFSAHAGFCIDPDPKQLGGRWDVNKHIDRALNWRLFLKSLEAILLEAEKLDLSFFIENNVTSKVNLRKDGTEVFFCSRPEEMAKLVNEVNSHRFGLLLDTAHLKVSSLALDFNKDQAVEKIKKHVKYIHHSDNDGEWDSNSPIDGDYWFLPWIHKFKECTHILEVKSINIDQIKEQLSILKAMSIDKIPIYRPYINEEEGELVAQCMQSTWISSQGKFIQDFEEKVQDYTGANHAITVSNGTVALHLAMLALEIGPGDEVITTNFTYVASSNSILYVGATPVFVDIDPLSWNLDPSLIEKKITSKTKAILFTNIYGTPADYYGLKKVADKYGLFLIEDAAESFGATYDSRISGTLGDVSTFSFFGNKTITTGEGGMVLTPHLELSDKIRKLKNQGNSDTVRYYHDILGYNYRMTNIQAAIGIVQLGKIHEILNLKRELQKNYEDGLKDILDFQRVPRIANSSYWMSSILFKSEDQKLRVKKVLESGNIETRPFFIPIDELPFYKMSMDCPHSKDISNRGMNLPSFPALKKSEQNRIIEIIRNNIEVK